MRKLDPPPSSADFVTKGNKPEKIWSTWFALIYDNFLSLLDVLKTGSVAASYVSLKASSHAGSNITGYQNVEYDAINTTGKGITVNLTNNSIAFDNPGTYILTLYASLTHNESTSARTVNVRIVNATQFFPGQVLSVGVAKNQTQTNINITILFDLGEANVGDEIVFQVGGGDTLSSVNWDSTSLIAYNVGEWKRELG
jgi:hypothetical protein